MLPGLREAPFAAAKPTLIVFDIDGCQAMGLDEALALLPIRQPLGAKICILSMKLSPELGCSGSPGFRRGGLYRQRYHPVRAHPGREERRQRARPMSTRASPVACYAAARRRQDVREELASSRPVKPR